LIPPSIRIKPVGEHYSPKSRDNGVARPYNFFTKFCSGLEDPLFGRAYREFVRFRLISINNLLHWRDAR